MDKTIPILRATLIAGTVQFGSIRKLARRLGIPSSTIHDWIRGATVPSDLAQVGVWAALKREGVTAEWEVKTESEGEK